MKIVVTGATGLLGRAVMARLRRNAGDEIVGLCHTRTGEGLVPAARCGRCARAGRQRLRTLQGGRRDRPRHFLRRGA